MDKNQIQVKRNWGWMAQFMPRVVAMLGEYRAKGHGAHIDECWRQGVRLQQPGWFYARENGVSVGTPFSQAETSDVLRKFSTWEFAKDQAMLLIKEIEGKPNGAN